MDGYREVVYLEVRDKDYVVSEMKEPSKVELKGEILTADQTTTN